MWDTGVRVRDIQKWEAVNSFPQQVNYTVGEDNWGLHINIIYHILSSMLRMATAVMVGFLFGDWLIVCQPLYNFSSVQFTQLYLALCDPVDCSMPGFPVHHQLPELAQTHVHWVGDAIQPSHHLSSPSPPAFNLSQNQGLFKWVSSLHQVAKGLEFQLQHQSFQWIFRTDLL